jgi:hypothetical protein
LIAGAAAAGSGTADHRGYATVTSAREDVGAKDRAAGHGEAAVPDICLAISACMACASAIAADSGRT